VTAGSEGPVASIGVDVGASKTASGLVEFPSGRVLASASVATPLLGSVADHVDHVVQAAARMLEEAGARSVHVAGVGVGVCELVNRDGHVRSAASVELRGDRLAAELSSLADVVIVDSDVRAHALAEVRFGRGRAFDDFAFVSAGTGISSCLVIGGKPYPGARGNAIVLSSAPVTVRCSSCGAITSEIVEDVASGRAIAAAWGTGTAEDAFEAAAAGEGRAGAILDHAATSLGSSIAFLANVADPGAIVIGGGLASAPRSFWSDVEREMRERIWSEETRALPFVLTELGPEAGVVAAASLAAEPEG
jgi:glucokinase